tara:strand:- start:1259 stop:1732 length:474 start_codon:yes stop_codon:yes gene_type:complete
MTIRNYNTGFKNTLQTDLRQGLGAEKARQSGFEEYFGRLSKTATYDSFDFTNDSFYVEHKERNIPFGKYDSLFFDAIKFHEFQRLKTLEPHKRFVIIWTCLGKSFFWEFQENDEDDQGNIIYYFENKVIDRRRGQGLQTQGLCKVFNNHIKPLSDFR